MQYLDADTAHGKTQKELNRRDEDEAPEIAARMAAALAERPSPIHPKADGGHSDEAEGNRH